MKHDWFYMKGADKHGQLLPTDLVWREGMEDWKRARRVDGLFDGSSSTAPSNVAASTPASAASQKKRPPAPPGNLLGSAELNKRPAPPRGNLARSAEPVTAPKPTTAPPTGHRAAPATNYRPSPPSTAGDPPVAALAGTDGIFNCPNCRQEISNDPSVAGEVESIGNDYLHYLGRAADAGGLDFWLAQFAAGQTNEDVIAGFTGSAEYYKKHTTGD